MKDSKATTTTTATATAETAPLNETTTIDFVGVDKNGKETPLTVIDDNYRTATEQDREEQTESVKTFGFLTPISLSQTPDGLHVVGGYGRIAISNDLKIPVPFVMLEDTQTEAVQLLQVQNNIHAKDKKKEVQGVITRLGKLGKTIQEIIKITGLHPDTVKKYVSIDEDAQKLAENLGVTINTIKDSSLNHLSLANMQSLTDEEKQLVSLKSQQGEKQGGKELGDILDAKAKAKKEADALKAQGQKKNTAKTVKKAVYLNKLSTKQVFDILLLVKETEDTEKKAEKALKAVTRIFDAITVESEELV